MDILSIIITVLFSIFAICLSIRSSKVLKFFKEYVEVFFEKERLLRGYDYHKESFKQIISKPEDIETVKESISKYQLNIKQIFSDESNYQIRVYDCNWSDIQQCSKYEDYIIEIIKEKHRKTMPKIYYPNKSKRGQYGFVVKITSSGSLLQINSYYFIFFRLGGNFQFNDNQKINQWRPQGFWLITKTIDENNTKYPFIFKPEPNKSFSLTADDFMNKKNNHGLDTKIN